MLASPLHQQGKLQKVSRDPILLNSPPQLLEQCLQVQLSNPYWSAESFIYIT